MNCFIDPDFEKAVFALNPNQFSDIVLTRSGYHLITISDKKPPHVFPLAEIAQKLEAFLKQKETQKKIDYFIAEKREEAKIITNL